MMAYEINKSNMANDIVLTISLILSLIISELIIILGNVIKNETIIFFLLNFVIVKITYNELSKIAKIYHIRKGIRD